VVEIDRTVERLPEPGEQTLIAGVALPVIAIHALEASAPIKLEMALLHFGFKFP
jgi:hypothetical protein